MTHMKQAHDVAETYEQAMAKFSATLDDARRHWAAYMLTEFPDREALLEAAARACQQLSAEAVQVNVIYGGRQVTIASVPVSPRRVIPSRNSLCVLTVGAGRPLAIDDIESDPITRHHVVRKQWGSWASVPICVDGFPVGTICALDHDAREWVTADQEVMEQIAVDLTKKVQSWVDAERKA